MSKTAAETTVRYKIENENNGKIDIKPPIASKIDHFN
jgi:hypothetical protein